MRVFSLTPVLLACAASVVVAPKPKAPGNVHIVAVCPPTGSCSLKATWTLPGSFRATDSLKVQWTQTAPTAVSFPVVPTRGTSDTLTLPRPTEAVPYGGKICITTTRPGSTSNPTACANWSAPATSVTPPDSVGNLNVSPASATTVPGGTIQFTAS